MKLLGIDPSGTGTTAFSIFLINDNNNEIEDVFFFEFNDKLWKNHYNFVKKIINENNPDFLIFEDTNYIIRRNKDSLSLFRLLGAIEMIDYKKINIFSINVLKVKILKRKLINKKIIINNLDYSIGRGRGWTFKKTKISTHSLDSYLVAYIWLLEKKN